jgi:hypothetical protein
MRHTRPILAFAALFCLPCLPVAAEEAPPATTPAPKADAKKAAREDQKQPAAKAAPSDAPNMIVTRDPETGELRPATAAEREKLLGRRPLVSPERKVVTLPGGGVMVELGEADMSYAVATRSTSGTISQTCVHGAPAARKAVSTPVPPARATPADR